MHSFTAVLAFLFVGPLAGVLSMGSAVDALDLALVGANTRHHPGTPAVRCSKANKKNQAKVADVQYCINYLKNLPPTQECTIPLGDAGIGFQHHGTARLVGIVHNNCTGPVSFNCNRIAGVFEDMLHSCESDGRVEAAKFLAPNGFSEQHPQHACKKTDNQVVVGIVQF